MAKGKKTKVGIYHPPKSGMPYLVVIVSPEGVQAIACDSKHQARVFASSTAQKVAVEDARAAKIKPTT
jgi:hypothetical protein